MPTISVLDAISPLDGRYRKKVEPLAKIFSERGLHYRRANVEDEYLIRLSDYLEGRGPRKFSKAEKNLLRDLTNHTREDAYFIKIIEEEDHGIPEINNGKRTNHDVKAVEYYLKYNLADTSLADSTEWIHFALTSEDPNNIAYGLMLSDGIGNVILPELEKVYNKLEDFAGAYKLVSMLARTHGQPASPTTAGKEFKNYAARLKKQVNQLKKHKISVKLNGATGNYNAHYVAFPDVDWLDFTKEFIHPFNKGRRIKLEPNYITTQVEPHDTYSELFDIMKRINVILNSFDKNVWRYISDDWFVQKPVEGEVGSSTMPHKINPIDFENSEGNLAYANAIFEFLSRELPDERLQRHLEDSTLERNFGVPLGHSLVGYKSLLKGMGKITVNEQKVAEALNEHPEVISEAIQTILRREGYKMPYEQLKKLTRGKKVTIDILKTFIEELEVSDKVKAELSQITPTNYTGIASRLVEL